MIDAPDASIFNRCVRCGLCLPTCPTYMETLTETSGPRGRISLIKAVAEERLDVLSPGFVHQMSECLDCRACEAVCPSGVQYGQLVESARSQIARAQDPRRSPLARAARRFALRTLFGNLAAMRFAAALLRFYQRSGIQRLVRASGLLRLMGLRDAEAFAPCVSDSSFVPTGQRYDVPDARATVFLHAGCIMQVAFAHVHQATIRVLNRNGIGVVIPSGQGCCGAIAVHAGESDFGRELAKRNIAAFERSGAGYYIVNAAGCGSALKEYGAMFSGDPDWSERAEAFSKRVFDVLEFLDRVGLSSAGMTTRSQTVTYQEPCHLAHAQRITAAPRRLLNAIPGLELREMAESSVCCGSAGIYNLTQPEMSRRLGERKCENATATGAQTVVTANPGCALQLSTFLRAHESPMKVRHVVELLDDAYAS